MCKLAIKIARHLAADDETAEDVAAVFVLSLAISGKDAPLVRLLASAGSAEAAVARARGIRELCISSRGRILDALGALHVLGFIEPEPPSTGADR